MKTHSELPEKLAWLAAPAPHKKLADMRASGVLRELLPEVDALYGIPQSPEHHPEIDSGIHTELTLEAAELLSDEPRVRFAALVHDLGKALTPAHELPQHINHEHAGLKPVARVCERFGVPSDWRKLALLVCELHLKVHRAFEMNPKSVVRLYATSGLEADPELVVPFLAAVEADKRGRAGRLHSSYSQGAYLREAFIELRALPMNDEAEPGTAEWQVAHRSRVNAVNRVLAKHQAMREQASD